MKLTVIFGRISLRGFDFHRNRDGDETVAWLQFPTGHYVQAEYRR